MVPNSSLEEFIPLALDIYKEFDSILLALGEFTEINYINPPRIEFFLVVKFSMGERKYVPKDFLWVIIRKRPRKVIKEPERALPIRLLERGTGKVVKRGKVTLFPLTLKSREKVFIGIANGIPVLIYYSLGDNLLKIGVPIRVEDLRVFSFLMGMITE